MTAAKAAEEAEEAARKEEELQAQRKLDSKELAGETIRRELAESKLQLILLFVSERWAWRWGFRLTQCFRGSRYGTPTGCGRHRWPRPRTRI